MVLSFVMILSILVYVIRLVHVESSFIKNVTCAHKIQKDQNITHHNDNCRLIKSKINHIVVTSNETILYPGSIIYSGQTINLKFPYFDYSKEYIVESTLGIFTDASAILPICKYSRTGSSKNMTNTSELKTHTLIFQRV